MTKKKTTRQVKNQKVKRMEVTKGVIKNPSPLFKKL